MRTLRKTDRTHRGALRTLVLRFLLQGTTRYVLALPPKKKFCPPLPPFLSAPLLQRRRLPCCRPCLQRLWRSELVGVAPSCHRLVIYRIRGESSVAGIRRLDIINSALIDCVEAAVVKCDRILSRALSRSAIAKRLYSVRVGIIDDGELERNSLFRYRGLPSRRINKQLVFLQ